MAELLSVTELNEYLRCLMEGDALLSDILVRGEVSNFKNHYATGHLYFSLKDETGAVRAVMFRSYASRLRFQPENGMKVIVHGRVSVFPRSGDYQIYVNEMQPDGAGALAVAFEQLRRKLEAEGLFDKARKRPLPPYPTRIGLITSPTGAAVRDMLQVLGRRYPLSDVVLFPALVQGPGAPESLVKGLRCFAGEVPVDLIIIGRGGGSMEDLWCFNHENVVRAVAASPVPVISAVGHETDFTLCDFAADLRAPTPSAAAELAVPDKTELAARITALAGRAEAAERQVLVSLREKLRRLAGSAALSSPRYVLDRERMTLDLLAQKLIHEGQGLVPPRRAALAALCGKLSALNPAGVLARGFGIVFDETGHTVSTVETLSEDETIRVKLADGDVTATVHTVRKGAANGGKKVKI